LDAEPGLRLANSVKLYWINRGLLELGHRVTTEALARTAQADRTFLRCRGLYEAGQLCSYMGRYDEARRDLEESLAIARERDDERAIGIVLQPLGMAALGQGDVAAARGYLQEAFERAEGGDPRALAAAANELGQIHRVEANLPRAQALYERALAIAGELGDREAIAIALLNMAMLRSTQGDGAAAVALLLQALDIAAEVGSRRMTQSALEVAAGLAATEEAWTEAARLFGAAAAQATDTGLRREPADEAFLAPLMARVRDSLAGGFDVLEAQGRALTDSEATREAREWLTSR
jgi:tetratricopeptide (TPR) repeat protein